jgi:hypothetical protein
MKRLFDVRWLSRATVLEDFARTYKTIRKTLAEDPEKADDEVLCSIYEDICQPEFVLCIFLSLNIMCIIGKLQRNFQKADLLIY